jgi:tetratricopeptide (TPR) repeat protein
MPTLVALLVSTALLSAPIEVLRRDYDAFVRGTRDGNPVAAERLAGWPALDVKAAVGDLKERARQRQTGAGPEDLEAAALLHTEAGYLLAAGQHEVPAALHLGIARELVEGASRDFACSWWLAMSYRQGGASETLRQVEALVQADRTCGDLPELWLAHGALAEFIFTFGPDSPSLRSHVLGRDLERVTNSALVRKLLEPRPIDQGALAAGYYRRVLRDDPRQWEAHLRLARFLRLSGRPEQGVPHLEAVLEGSRDPRERYLARLFLGDAQLLRGAHADAVQNLRAASQMGSGAFAAAIALARADVGAGERAAARAALLSYLSRDASLDVIDPWIVYNVGVPLDGSARALARLHERVRPK